MKRFFNVKRLSIWLCLLVFCSFFTTFTACKKKLDYFSYVSELRDNIFLAETDSYSLRAYSVLKESPYLADGIAMDKNRRIEVCFIAPQGNANCSISFCVDDKDYGGEMSFDNVKTEYYFSCALDVSALRELHFIVTYGDERLDMSAHSVLSGKELPAKSVLEILRTESPEPFDALTDKYGFAGEIYLRLIYEDNPYYYVGIIDRNGKIYAFLMNAVTGGILAQRESA